MLGWSCGRMVHWSVGWLVSRLVDCIDCPLVGWLVGRKVGWQVGWLVLFVWLVCWLISWLHGSCLVGSWD